MGPNRIGGESRLPCGPMRLPPDTRVLIVEDHPFVALAVADMVIELGGVVAAMPATIEAALEAVVRNDFLVALLDIDLAGRASDPVAAALAAAGTPFLITTGFSDRTIPGFEAAPLLLKPFLPSQLGRSLCAVLTPRD